MRRMLTVLLGMLLILTANVVKAANLSWTGPTLYVDGTAIPTADQARITYIPYSGATSSGPWTAGTGTSAGATTAVMADPAPGGSRWYTVDATLDGMTGVKAVAASKSVPFRTPGIPVLVVQ
mgnify:CR=1 FL=1